MSHADGYIEIPTQTDIVEAGEVVEVTVLLTMSHTSPLTTAPLFELPTQKGEHALAASFLSKGPVLLAFHRGTW